MTHLDDDRLRRLERALRLERDRIVELIAGLQRSLANILEAAAASNVDDEHDPEGATVGFERAQVTTLLRDAEARQVAIDAALERVGSGTYGGCESCGRPIPLERLAARPASTLCVACASRRSSRG